MPTAHMCMGMHMHMHEMRVRTCVSLNLRSSSTSLRNSDNSSLCTSGAVHSQGASGERTHTMHAQSRRPTALSIRGDAHAALSHLAQVLIEFDEEPLRLCGVDRHAEHVHAHVQLGHVDGAVLVAIHQLNCGRHVHMQPRARESRVAQLASAAGRGRAVA